MFLCTHTQFFKEKIHGRDPSGPRWLQNRPFFNIVATDSRNRRDGRFIERVGFYNPLATEGEEGLRIAQDRLSYWQGVGAQLSPTVARLVKQGAKKAAA